MLMHGSAEHHFAAALTCNVAGEPLILLEPETLVQCFPDFFLTERPRRAVDDLEPLEDPVLVVALECLVFVDDHVHDAVVIDPARAVVLPHLIRRHEVGPDLGVLDVVVGEILQTLPRVLPVGRFVVEEPLHELGPRVELFPGSAKGCQCECLLSVARKSWDRLTPEPSAANCGLPPRGTPPCRGASGQSASWPRVSSRRWGCSCRYTVRRAG